MNVEALLLAGVPPLGTGVFARASIPSGHWRWIAVVAGANAARDVAAVRARGAEPWLYLAEDAWTPTNWQHNLAVLVGHARDLNVPRIIVDPEHGASDVGMMTALGLALAQLADDFRIGVTSYPSAPNMPILLAPLGSRVFGIVQIYGLARDLAGVPSTRYATVLAAWYGRFSALFGPRLIHAAAGWNAGPMQAGPAEFASYLRALPHAMGTAFWYEGSGIDNDMLVAIASYEPGGSVPGTVALAAEAYASRLVGAASIAALAALLVGLALAAGKAGA